MASPSPAEDREVAYPRLIELGIALSAEHNHARLLEKILLGAKELTNADGGTLYLVGDGGRELSFTIMRNDTMGIALGGTTGAPIPFPPVPLLEPDGAPNYKNVVAAAALTGDTINLADAYNAPGFDFSATRAFDARTGYRSQSFLNVPLRSHDAEVAGGLHDCGKVTTREFVVDKATKLETSYNRIHEVRTRFEIVKRDAEIEYLRAVMAGGDEPALRSVRDARLAELDDDFAFVAECNIGSEFMAPEKIARLQRIAGITWQRTLDDRLGLSWEESARQPQTRESLAATEHLLADKRTHIIEHDVAPVPPENPWGFVIKPPPHKANLGEVYNLSIRRGTLTEEERFHINDHIVQTIIMLEALPYPKHLRRVPEWAGGHHEKMDGTGYPRGLKRDQMSIPARIMMIADIFEALTARDRPYKARKKLSECVEIMGRMSREGHIDPDLFALFLTSGVYRAYAAKFLLEEQIDEVDVARYLGAPSEREAAVA